MDGSEDSLYVSVEDGFASLPPSRPSSPPPPRPDYIAEGDRLIRLAPVAPDAWTLGVPAEPIKKIMYGHYNPAIQAPEWDFVNVESEYRNVIQEAMDLAILLVRHPKSVHGLKDLFSPGSAHVWGDAIETAVKEIIEDEQWIVVIDKSLPDHVVTCWYGPGENGKNPDAPRALYINFSYVLWLARPEMMGQWTTYRRQCFFIAMALGEEIVHSLRYLVQQWMNTYRPRLGYPTMPLNQFQKTGKWHSNMGWSWHAHVLDGWLVGVLQGPIDADTWKSIAGKRYIPSGKPDDPTDHLCLVSPWRNGHHGLRIIDDKWILRLFGYFMINRFDQVKDLTVPMQKEPFRLAHRMTVHTLHKAYDFEWADEQNTPGAKFRRSQDPGTAITTNVPNANYDPEDPLDIAMDGLYIV